MPVFLYLFNIFYDLVQDFLSRYWNHVDKLHCQTDITFCFCLLPHGFDLIEFVFDFDDCARFDLKQAGFGFEDWFVWVCFVDAQKNHVHFYVHDLEFVAVDFSGFFRYFDYPVCDLTDLVVCSVGRDVDFNGSREPGYVAVVHNGVQVIV